MTLRNMSQQNCIFFWLAIPNTHFHLFLFWLLYTFLSWAAWNCSQLVQNAAARLSTATSRQSHIITVLAGLHFGVRINYNIVLTTYKSLHKFGSDYVSDLTQSTSRPLLFSLFIIYNMYIKQVQKHVVCVTEINVFWVCTGWNSAVLINHLYSALFWS